MTDPTFEITKRAARADRAIGAMFFSFFGGCWLVLWTHRARADNPAVLAIVIAIALAVLATAFFRSRKLRLGVAVVEDSPEKKRRDRLFHYVNAGQYILIFVFGNVLTNLGLSAWFIPLALFIIGLHFFPLARLFSFRGHYVTGSALIVLALVYPQLAAGGPADPVGCLGAGIILLCAALAALASGTALLAAPTRAV
jgi:hypothetical protein